MNICEWSGTKPTVIQPESIGKMLDIMIEQLKIIKQMGTSIVLIERGTKITLVKEPSVEEKKKSG